MIPNKPGLFLEGVTQVKSQIYSGQRAFLRSRQRVAPANHTQAKGSLMPWEKGRAKRKWLTTRQDVSSKHFFPL